MLCEHLGFISRMPHRIGDLLYWDWNPATATGQGQGQGPGPGPGPEPGHRQQNWGRRSPGPSHRATKTREQGHRGRARNRYTGRSTGTGPPGPGHKARATRPGHTSPDQTKINLYPATQAKKNKRNMASSSTLDLALLLAACARTSLQPQLHCSFTKNTMKHPTLNPKPYTLNLKAPTPGLFLLGSAFAGGAGLKFGWKAWNRCLRFEVKGYSTVWLSSCLWTFCEWVIFAGPSRSGSLMTEKNRHVSWRLHGSCLDGSAALGWATVTWSLEGCAYDFH